MHSYFMIIDQQNVKYIHFLTTNVLQKVFILLHMEQQSTSQSEHLFSFSSNFFTYRLNFSLSFDP